MVFSSIVFKYILPQDSSGIKNKNLNKKKYDKIIKTKSHNNIGSGKEVSIKALAKIIKKIVNYKGKIKFDTTKPDGTFRKLTNTRRLVKIGFKHKIYLKDGLKKTYNEFQSEN